MEVNEQTLQELQPIFTFLNSHANKLYQEGYFLKLNDQDTQGRANADRTWTECFAQLVGTVLSLWDAAELDAAGHDGEVLPKFINLTDASIKMIESLPTRANDDQPLQNVLSVSTAGKNRYLLHFNSHHSLIQWTAGIRLAMYEHTTLQEAYTGALIAGKGKALNNINMILERKRVKYEDWVRVRFGAGTPWRRCWCVVNPPDEKEYNKLQKDWSRNRSAYDRSRPPVLKGSVKFYESRKVTKRSRPIATITDAYAAYAIYPQSKPLIDSSTLVKLEGTITIHSATPLITEGFVFVMPDVHDAVSGLEMMLRWLFPVFDTFALYGRPQRLVADTLDPRSLMFAMPQDRRYGYLEILDVSALTLQDGSQGWKEIEWRRKMKELTARRMATLMERGGSLSSRYSRRRNTRYSALHRHADGTASIRSSPSVKFNHRPCTEDGPVPSLPRSDTAPAAAMNGKLRQQHGRSVSETQGLNRYETDSGSSCLDAQYGGAPQPLANHTFPLKTGYDSNLKYSNDMPPTPERVSSEDDEQVFPERDIQEMQQTSQPEPVALPPAFSHAPGARPMRKPLASELRGEQAANMRAQMSVTSGFSHVVGVVHNGQPNKKNERVLQISAIETSMNKADVTPLIEGTIGIGVSGLSDEHAPVSLSGDAEHINKHDSRGSGDNQKLTIPSAIESFYGNHARHSITRKPLPTSSTYSSLAATPEPEGQAQEPDPSSIDSYYNKAPGFDRQPIDDRNPDKPRIGVMKTAGDPELGTSNNVATGEPLVPEFDFGPTVTLQRLKTPADDAATEAKRNARLALVPLYSAGAVTSSSTDNVNRAVTGEPSAKAAPATGSTLTPEPFAQNRPAGLSHMPQSSSDARRAITPDPKLGHSRGVSGDVYQKPYSKSSDNLVPRRPVPMNTGLVGEIGAREKEKKELKHTVNSQAMRQALEKNQQRQSSSYDKRRSLPLTIQQQSHQPQYPQAQQHYGGPFIPQAYAAVVQAPIMHIPMTQAQFAQGAPVCGYTASPVEQQDSPHFPGQDVPHHGRGQGY